MKTRPFDLEAAKAGAKVVTSDGREVRVICWDMVSEGRHNIVALVKTPRGTEKLQVYYPNGELISDSSRMGNKDLFLLDEPDIRDEMHTLREWQEILATHPELMEEFERLTPPRPIDGGGSELTEFEVALLNALMNARSIQYVDAIEGAVQDTAKTLLELAKKELCQKGELLTQEHHQKLMDVLLEELKTDGKAMLYVNEKAHSRGVREGKAEALKDLPKWRKWKNGACGNGQGYKIAIVKYARGYYDLVDALGIEGTEYIMLQDLDKLPKED